MGLGLSLTPDHASGVRNFPGEEREGTRTRTREEKSGWSALLSCPLVPFFSSFSSSARLASVVFSVCKSMVGLHFAMCLLHFFCHTTHTLLLSGPGRRMFPVFISFQKETGRILRLLGPRQIDNLLTLLSCVPGVCTPFVCSECLSQYTPPLLHSSRNMHAGKRRKPEKGRK